MNIPRNQYLFDWITFYKNKCCSKFPPQLCYPEFYALAMTAILNWYEIITTTPAIAVTTKCFVDDIRSLCFEYFKSIQSMIHLLFGMDSDIHVISPEEIHTIITNYVVELNVSDTSIFFLESILKDDGKSITNYRKLLMNTTLTYYDVDDLETFMENLKSQGVCTDCDYNIIKTTHLPPPSCHYVSYLSNSTSIPIQGPSRWGPIYWIIFHALVENLKTNSDVHHCHHPNLLNMVNAYVAILPFIVPCNQCREHYYQLIRPGEIPDLTDIDSLVHLYQRIHSLVSRAISRQNIKRIRSGSSRYAHQGGTNEIT